MPPEPRLRVRNLRREGLVSASLDLAAGETLAILGPSGSGKSLLLRAIADLDPADGELSLDGVARETIPAPDWRRQVAYVPAEPGWWADRVADHIADPAAGRALLAPLGLPEAALGWEVARLSTGEKQRLALLRALALRPKVLLLDEPTASLDRETTLQVEAALRARRVEGCALLLVTHEPDQATRLGARVRRLRAGRLLEEERAR